MKKVVYISLMWLSIMLMVFTPFVRHHHHGDKICYIEEICDIDGHTNDRHTAHSENEEDDCPLKQIHNVIDNVKHTQIAPNFTATFLSCPLAVLTSITYNYYSPMATTVELVGVFSKAVDAMIPVNHRRGPPTAIAIG